MHVKNTNTILTWAALVAMIAGAVAFYDDLHHEFAKQVDIEVLQSDVGDCVTNDELTIKLLQFESSLYEPEK